MTQVVSHYSTSFECKQFFEATFMSESLSFTLPVWRGHFVQCPIDLIKATPWIL
jgi:hypothetical protein